MINCMHACYKPTLSFLSSMARHWRGYTAIFPIIFVDRKSCSYRPLSSFLEPAYSVCIDEGQRRQGRSGINDQMNDIVWSWGGFNGSGGRNPGVLDSGLLPSVVDLVIWVDAFVTTSSVPCTTPCLQCHSYDTWYLTKVEPMYGGRLSVMEITAVPSHTPVQNSLRWEWRKYFTYFFFARISQSLEDILIPACRFLLECSEAEISIDIAVQSSRDAQYLT